MRVKIDVETEPIDAFRQFISTFDRVNVELGRQTTQAVAPGLLNDLRRQPGPVKRPILWTSEKQRRAYFATDGFGKGIPYKRSGRLAAAWEVEGKADADGFTLRARNPVESAQYVYGTLSQRSIIEAARPQQRFHRNTGWQLAVRSVNQWFDTAQDEYERRFNQELSEFGTITKARRRSRRR